MKMSNVFREAFIKLGLGRYAKRVSNKGLYLLPMAALIAVLAPTGGSIVAIYAATTRTINVDKLDDNNPQGGCTLREAIDVANAGLGAGTSANGCSVTGSGTGNPITYQINLPSYIYTLTGAAGEDGNLSGDLDILANMTINGTGTDSTIIDGGSIDRVFHLPISGLGITLTLSNITVQNGRVTGGNSSGDGDGGGIFNRGNTLIISNSIIARNIASSRSGGGDIDFGGGGIDNEAGRLLISNSTIANNMANGWGGGIFSTGSDVVTITNSVITNNQATTVNNGISKSGGGGISIITDVGAVSISNTMIANNTAEFGGGIYDANVVPPFGAHTTSTLNINKSTIANNIARVDGGGISIDAVFGKIMNIANSTISGNFANRNGGGISHFNATTNLTNVTITNNTADNDSSGNGDGGGIYHNNGTFNLKNTIVAGNHNRGVGTTDCSGDFVSQQYNLIGINTGCVTSFPGGQPNGNNDFVGTDGLPLDALFGGLIGNPTYHWLLAGSPAIDKIPRANCTFISSGDNPLFANGAAIITDQPGTVRDSTCDIGAFEAPLVGIQMLDGVTDILDDTGSVDFGTTILGVPVTKTFTVKNIGKTTALTLSDLTVPAGFSIASHFGSTTVVPGGQTTFAIKFNVTAVSKFSGRLSFTNNAIKTNPFTFTMDGAVESVWHTDLPIILRNNTNR